MDFFVLTIFSILGIYLLLGAIFSIFFLWKGIEKVDPGAKEAGLFFKLLLFPGMVVFWILFLVKWIRSNKITN